MIGFRRAPNINPLSQQAPNFIPLHGTASIVVPICQNHSSLRRRFSQCRNSAHHDDYLRSLSIEADQIVRPAKPGPDVLVGEWIDLIEITGSILFVL